MRRCLLSNALLYVVPVVKGVRISAKDAVSEMHINFYFTKELVDNTEVEQ